MEQTIWLSARLLLLLATANTSPLISKRIFGTRLATPLDRGLLFFDGRPLLGASKTVRGALTAIVATAVAALLLGIGPALGALIGAAAMAGDAFSSFVKRRLAIPSSGRATGLDQIPEALLPLLAARHALDLSGMQIACITLLFAVLEIPLARLWFQLGWRDQPY
ncbi:MAG TPA: CDP-archaeol synthase [Burkholderiaceae bacterium]|nr:CDP-archaeol synthase [Burkholderiaceae bacterium]